MKATSIHLILITIASSLIIFMTASCNEENNDKSIEKEDETKDFLAEIDYSLSGDGSNYVVSYMRSGKALHYLNDNLYDHLTHIIILAQNESYTVQEDGHILPSDGLIEVLQEAVIRRGNRKTKLILSFGGGNDFYIPLIQNNVKMNNYLNDFKELCVSYGLDGADLDWEHPESLDQHIAAGIFAEKMHEIFKPEGLLLTQAIIWYNIGHMKAVVPYVDYINVMIYDNFDQQDCHSPYSDFTKFVDNILANGIPEEKILAGLPFYGYVSVADWSQKGGYAYSSILNQYKPGIGEDIVYRIDGKAICFDGVTKIWKKCVYALEKDLAGVFIWETWMDVPNFKSDSSLMYHVNTVFPVNNNN